MIHKNSFRSAWLVVAVFLAGFLMGSGEAAAREFHPQGWELPNMYGAARYFDDSVDFDYSYPGRETRLEKFKTPKGGRIYRYSFEGKVFAYEVDHDSKSPLDFEIVDLDGDGVFEMRMSPYDEYPLPEWTYR